MGQIEPRPQQTFPLQSADQRSTVFGVFLARLQGHGLGFVDVGEDRQVVFFGQGLGTLDQFGGAALRCRWTKRPCDAVAGPAALDIIFNEISELVEFLVRFGGGGQIAVQLLGKHLAPERNGVDAPAVGILQGNDGADADLLVRLDDRGKVVGIERVERHHVLHGGDARTQAFQRAEKRPRLDLLATALRIGRRQGEKTPSLKRRFFHHALGQGVV